MYSISFTWYTAKRLGEYESVVEGNAKGFGGAELGEPAKERSIKSEQTGGRVGWRQASVVLLCWLAVGGGENTLHCAAEGIWLYLAEVILRIWCGAAGGAAHTAAQ